MNPEKLEILEVFGVYPNAKLLYYRNHNYLMPETYTIYLSDGSTRIYQLENFIDLGIDNNTFLGINFKNQKITIVGAENREIAMTKGDFDDVFYLDEDMQDLSAL